MHPPTSLSVIMPVLNEAARIGRSLDHLAGLAGIDEVLIVDGGSTDRTVELATRPGVRVLAAPRGRGPQLNFGAGAAGGEILLFLHADVELPADAAALARATLAIDGVVAGAFRTHTYAEPATGYPLGPLLRCADLRSRLSNLPYGDQALFVRREWFQRAGGYPDQPIMEDLALSRALRRLGRIVVLERCVRVSGRRFQQHPIASIVLMRSLPLLHRLGVPPQRLARLYRDPR